MLVNFHFHDWLSGFWHKQSAWISWVLNSFHTCKSTRNQFHAIHTMLRLGTRICPDVFFRLPHGSCKSPACQKHHKWLGMPKLVWCFRWIPCALSGLNFWRPTNCVDLRVPIMYQKLVPKFCACAFVTSSLSKNWSPFAPRKTTIGKADHPFVPETSHKTWVNFPLPHWIPGGYLNLSSCTQPKMQTQAACPEFLVWLFKDC